jgi:hypothetical protein
MTDCACVVTGGVKPKPPAAVAARGLTPSVPPKQGSALDVSGGVVAAFVLSAIHLSGDFLPRAQAV